MSSNHVVRLVRRPVGALRTEDLECVPEPSPRPGPGEVLVRTTHHSVDAAVRLRLDPVSPPGYLPAYQLGETLEGLAVGTVVESRHPSFAVGDLVQHARGFRDLAVVDPAAAALGGAGALTVLDPDLGPAEIQLALLGGSGLTAYAALLVAGVRPGETVWVSSAAGSVGSIAAQLARTRGCRVVGSAGSAAKVAHLGSALGLHAAFDHHDDLAEALRRCAPEGIDVYVDNVGGGHLEAALDHLNPGGRVALCGAVSGYDGGPAPAVRNLFQATAKNLRLEGFRAGAFADRAGEVRRELADLWRRGELRVTVAGYDGLGRAPQALVDLLAGRTTGKVLVRGGRTEFDS